MEGGRNLAGRIPDAVVSQAGLDDGRYQLPAVYKTILSILCRFDRDLFVEPGQQRFELRVLLQRLDPRIHAGPRLGADAHRRSRHGAVALRSATTLGGGGSTMLRRRAAHNSSASLFWSK